MKNISKSIANGYDAGKRAIVNYVIETSDHIQIKI